MLRVYRAAVRRRSTSERPGLVRLWLKDVNLALQKQHTEKGSTLDGRLEFELGKEHFK